MAESKGPGTKAGNSAPGGKKRRSLIVRARPYVLTTVIMAVVFGISALIGAHVRAGKDSKIAEPRGVAAAVVVPTGPSDTASPSATPADQGPKFDVPVRGATPVTVTIVEDLRSPASKAFLNEYAPVLTQLLTTGQVQLHYRLVTGTDATYGGSGSLLAANAAACAQDQGRFTAFVAALFAEQPDPHHDAMANVSWLKSVAKKAHKIKMLTFQPCVEQRDHVGWVQKSQADFAASGLGDVPVVEINNVPVKDVQGSLTPQKLSKLVQNEAKKVIAAQATPSATASALG